MTTLINFDCYFLFIHSDMFKALALLAIGSLMTMSADSIRMNTHYRASFIYA